MREWWRGLAGREVARIRKEGAGAMLWSLRITLAAVASYAVGVAAFPGTTPLLAPLTAMLVVQVTPVSLLASGVDRVVAVVTGVSVAVVFADLVPLRWWSLGLLILSALALGHLFRLRDNLIEVAISAMLVLGVGSLASSTAAWQRILETLVGAAVGVLGNLVFPPKVASADAALAIDELADSVTAQMNAAADELDAAAAQGRDLVGPARRWLGEFRHLTHQMPRIGAAVLHAEESRRLNVRAVGKPDAGPGLRHGMEALEHSMISVRGMYRALADALPGATWLADEIAEDVLLGFAQTLRELAAGIDAFGQLVRDEADPSQSGVSLDVAQLREALEGLHEARARLDDLLVADGDPEVLELNAAVSATVRRLTRELDLDERMRRQLRLARSARPRMRPPDVRRRPRPEADALSEAETEVLPRVPKGPVD